MDYSTLNDILILFAAAVAVVVIFIRIKLPPILGYLIVGIILGPFGLAWISNSELTLAFAEFGVVFLLFTIGLEFSLSRIMHMRNIVFGLGGAQVILTTLIVASSAYYFDFTLESAIILGGIIAMSSTALVVRQLAQQVELHSRHGRNSIGILLFQDLAVIPFLILVTISASSTSETSFTSSIFSALGQGLIALLVILAVGRWILRPLFRTISHLKSTELFTLTVLLVTLAAAGLTHELGLSLALGGFLAGMMLGETEFRHQIEAEIRPFRDVLLGLFFITIGMQLNIGILSEFWVSVLSILALLFALKITLIYSLVRLFSYNSTVSLRTSLVLASGGEFGFAILSLALINQQFPHEFGQALLAALLISMGVAPLLIRFNKQITTFFIPRSMKQNQKEITTNVSMIAMNLNRHVILCGYGRVGQNVARFIEGEGIKYLAMDLDQTLVQNAVKAKEPVTYGDAANLAVLKSAGLEHAAAIVITLNDISSTLKILKSVRTVNTTIPIIVRAEDDTHLSELRNAGATEVIPETLEASLMLSSSLLLTLKVPMPMVYSMVHQVRKDHYQTLHHVFPGEGGGNGISSDKRKQLTAIELPEELNNITIKDTQFETLAVTITAIHRDKQRINLPPPSMQLMAGDLLILFATPLELDRAQTLLKKMKINASDVQ